MKPLLPRRLVALTVVALLAACGQREDQPPPLAKAPDTRSMGGAPGQCSVQAEEALQRINAARAAGRRCGSRSMPPAPPLKWDELLYSAAFGHSNDMARRNYFEHRSPTGSTVSDRVSASRYKWKNLGENLAAGNRSIGEVVDMWLNSPDHCENLMDAKFADVAVACVAQPGTDLGTYWTMVLGRQ